VVIDPRTLLAVITHDGSSNQASTRKDTPMRKALPLFLPIVLALVAAVVSYPLDGIPGWVAAVVAVAAACWAYQLRDGIPMRPATRAARARLSDALAELDAIDDDYESQRFLDAHDRIYAAEAELRWWQRIDMQISRNDGRGRGRS